MDQVDFIVILDNGASTIKVGFANDDKPRVIPNCITKIKSEKRRPFIADQMEECNDYSGMYYLLPFNRGYLLNWDIQLQIWDYIFRKTLKLPTDSKGRFSSVGILITEPVFNFPQLRRLMIKYLFEEYGFGSVLICSAPQLAAFHHIYEENQKQKTRKEFACLVVESGYSFTHIVPFVEGHKILPHMKRIDVGGKVLTNHLKDIISYRQINVMDETYVVNQMKEDCCYVSCDFWNDLDISKQKKDNGIQQEYILPDYIKHKRGFVRDKELHKDIITAENQIIRMNNERFQVPEILFHPSDVGLDQLGIPETIVYAVNEFNPDFQMPSIPTVTGQNTRERPENLKDIDSEEEEQEEEEEEGSEPEKESNDSKSIGSKSKSNQSMTTSTNASTSASENGSYSESVIDGDYSVYDDENIQAHLYNNILLIGGNCRFPNFRDRVYEELRHDAPAILDVRVRQPDDPITYGWHGGKLLCTLSVSGEEASKTKDMKSLLFHKYAVSRKEYQQYGLNHCQKKFSNYPIIF